MNLRNFIYFLCFSIQNVYSQHVSFHQQNPYFYNPCAEGNQTHRVEHFFNLIFSEFHSYPPVCVCVQMCPEQPTYCYPNNCFKNPHVLTKQHVQSSAQVSQLQSDKTQPLSFLVTPQEFRNLNSEALDIASKSKAQDSPVKFTQTNSFNDMAKKSFKERYKTTFKFRKTPQVQLRYNLREQIKHKKSDIIKIEKIDVSKSKWSVPVYENRRVITETKNQLKPVIDEKHINYFPPHYDIDLNSHYQSKFFKRDLGHKLQPKKNDQDIPTDDDSANFSLNDLIENLIDNSFSPIPNNTEVGLNDNVKYSPIEPITLPNKRSVLDEEPMNIANETINVVSISNTNESIQVNAYHRDYKDQMYRNVFNEMIASLSKNIEMNNNTSKEMMEHVLGLQVEGVNASDKREITNEISSIKTKQFLEYTSDPSITEKSPSVITPDKDTYENTTALDQIISTTLPIRRKLTTPSTEKRSKAIHTENETKSLPTEKRSTNSPPEMSTTDIPTEKSTTILTTKKETTALPTEKRNAALSSEKRNAALSSEKKNAALSSEKRNAALSSEKRKAALSSEKKNAALSSEKRTTAPPSEYRTTEISTETQYNLPNLSDFVRKEMTNANIEIDGRISKPTVRELVDRKKHSNTKKSHQVLPKKLRHSKKN